MVVYCYFTRIGIVESEKKSEDSGFPTSTGAYYGYFLSGWDGHVEITEDGSIGVIAKSDVFEFDGSAFQLQRLSVGFILGDGRSIVSMLFVCVWV